MTPKIPRAGGALLLLAPVLALGLTASAAADRLPAPVLINESASLPRGLWRQAEPITPHRPLRRGDVVAVPQPPQVRPILAALGVPADLPLLKRVAAVGGDRVCADGRGLVAPFRAIHVTRRDGRGRPLPVWTGCRALGPDEVLLLGDSAASFDGRHFGPIPRDRLLGRYRELLTW
ncbi:MAG: S26 family signal peptidase [Caulobacteraceae bacterium]|nr:S26 family signal peptidase [Caulobacteraceae bacterium]